MTIAALGPKVSVVMSVYNAEGYLARAVESIIGQTFGDFEFIILNDGSTDDSAQIIKNYRDSRIQYVEQENMGLAASLNKGILLSQGDYIARMDADDIALPFRFAKQVEFLDSHPDYALVGTARYIIDTNGKVKSEAPHPCEDVHIRWLCLFDSPFVHSSVMFKRQALEYIGLYRAEKGFHVEDYELWSRLLWHYPAANLEEPLLLYRDNPSGISHSRRSVQEQQSIAVSTKNIAQLLQDSSFTTQRGSQIRNLRNGTWSNPQREHIEEAIDDLTRIYSTFLTKHKERLASHPSVSAAIKKDLNRAYLAAAFFLGACSARSSGFRVMGRALKAEAGLCLQLRFWIALSSLLMVHRNFQRLRTLFHEFLLKRK